MALAVFAACCLAAGSGMGGCEGGTSSETVGMVEVAPGPGGMAGRTDAGNTVSLYAEGFLPHLDQGFADTVTADRDGAFAFADLEPGTYRLLVRRPSDGKAALLADLAIPSPSGDVRRASLEPTGTLSGRITDDTAAFQGSAYAPGTPFFAVGDDSLRYSLAGLPPGNYRFVKAWTRRAPCIPGSLCGGTETRQDTADVGIRPGADAAW